MGNGKSMKGWVKVVALLVIIMIIAAAGYYVITKLKAAEQTPGGGDGPDVVKVNATAISVYLSALDPQPSLASISFRLYAPDLGPVVGALADSAAAGVLWSGELFPGVGLEYHDLDNDSAAGIGDYFTVRSTNGPLRTGIWHVEMISPGPVSGEQQYRFHVLPAGTSSIAEDAAVHFIDVGQGDSELICTSDGKHVLIDAGPNGAETELLSYLETLGVDTLDALIITHPDADHAGGAKEVLEALEVRRVYHPGLAKNTSTFWTFLSAAEAEGCPIYTSEDVEAGDYLNLSVTEDFRVLSINASAEANDASIVVRMDAPSRSFLFTGDIGFEVEATLVSQYGADLDADVLKVAHHGSKTSSSEAFLNAVSPSVAVIEVGENSYGHPTNETLSRLAAVNAVIVRTDLAGTYVLVSEGGTVQ